MADPGSCLGSVSAASDLAALPTVRHFVDRLARDAHLSEEQSFNLKVAVSEACANAIEHATRRTSSVVVEGWLEDEKLTVSVLSQGNFRQRSPADSEVRRHRGFGLPLMVALTDQVCISRMGGGGLRVDLSLFLRRP